MPGVRVAGSDEATRRNGQLSLQHGVYGLDVGEHALPVGLLHGDHVIGVQQWEDARPLTVNTAGQMSDNDQWQAT